MTGNTVGQPESADLGGTVAKMQAQIDDLTAAVESKQDQLDHLSETVAAHQRLLEGWFSQGGASTSTGGEQ
jgi:hypothetical protein